jgi:hypothetical protein
VIVGSVLMYAGDGTFRSGKAFTSTITPQAGSCFPCRSRVFRTGIVRRAAVLGSKTIPGSARVVKATIAVRTFSYCKGVRSIESKTYVQERGCVHAMTEDNPSETPKEINPRYRSSIWLYNVYDVPTRTWHSQ